MSSIKPIKKNKPVKTIDTTPQVSTLRDPTELDNTRRSPLYLYNTLVRRNRPPLTLEQFNLMNRAALSSSRNRLEERLSITIIDDTD